jgi:hypothetical protein
MKTVESEVGLWRRIELGGVLSPTAARALLKVQFSAHDQDRMRLLSAKARAGTLTSQEEADIDTFERLGCLLDILHSKARLALAKRKPAS